MNTTFFDVIQFLDDFNIQYSESGKNIGGNWIGIEECPFCGAENNHCAINSTSKVFSCFVCGEKGSIAKFIFAHGISNTRGIIKKYSSGNIEFTEEKESAKKLIYPDKMYKISKKGLDYLKNRGFGEYHAAKYKLLMTKNNSFVIKESNKINFSNRIVIPIFQNGRIVNYIGRTYIDDELRYKNLINELAIIPIKNCVYNIDTVKYKKCIITEGTFDVMKLGDEAVSLFGVKWTFQQLKLLVDKGVKSSVIVFDTGAEEAARHLQNNLRNLIKNVSMFDFSSTGKKDVAEFSDAEALLFKKQLIG